MEWTHLGTGLHCPGFRKLLDTGSHSPFLGHSQPSWIPLNPQLILRLAHPQGQAKRGHPQSRRATRGCNCYSVGDAWCHSISLSGFDDMVGAAYICLGKLTNTENTQVLATNKWVCAIYKLLQACQFEWFTSSNCWSHELQQFQETQSLWIMNHHWRAESELVKLVP